jgi:hypothetical protein
VSAPQQLCGAGVLVSRRAEYRVMRTIYLDGTPVAIAGLGLVRLEDPLAALPPHAPARRFVSAMCLFNLSVEADDEYDD